MEYTEEIYNAAVILKGGQSEALRTYCAVAALAVSGRLREGVSVSNFYEIFIKACAMMAVAADSEFGSLNEVSSFKAGEVSVTRGGGGSSSAQALRKQAEALLVPYIYDNGFAFTTVEGD